MLLIFEGWSFHMIAPLKPLDVGGAVGGLKYLKRCLQALPTSPPTSPFFFGFSTSRPPLPLVCTD